MTLSPARNLLLAIVAAFTLAGCAPHVAGVYVPDEGPMVGHMVLTIERTGLFTFSTPEQIVTGVWQMEGDKLTLQAQVIGEAPASGPDAEPFNVEVADDRMSLTLPSGVKLVRQD